MAQRGCVTGQWGASTTAPPPFKLLCRDGRSVSGKAANRLDKDDAKTEGTKTMAARTRRRVTTKKELRSKLADRLQKGLKSAEVEVWEEGNDVKVSISRGDLLLTLSLDGDLFYDTQDIPYYLNLVARMWLQHLKNQMSDSMVTLWRAGGYA